MYRTSCYPIVRHPRYSSPSAYDNDVVISDMAGSVRAVEQLLNYRFMKKRDIECALTHPSCAEGESYQRLEFLGDQALGLAVSNHLFLEYPDADQGQLSLLRSANISTEKLARVAVRHRLYLYVRHNAIGLDTKVTEFASAVQKEDEQVVYGGVMKAPKVLADIVESVAAAVYVDCGYDLHKLWEVFGGLLEPIITLNELNQQPQPVTTLYEVCQKDGRQVNIKHRRKGEKNIASVYVDGQFVVSSSSGQKDNARLHAAEAALAKLSQHVTDDNMDMDIEVHNYVTRTYEIEGAKKKLHEICGKKRWPNPAYKVDKEVGPAHERKFVCSVQIETVDGLLFVAGDQMSRVRDSESSAASLMIHGLQEAKYI